MSIAFQPRPQPDRVFGLDLLRAAAILMVLLAHTISQFGAWCSFSAPSAIDRMGDMGVGIFFALSGFLIGRILIGLTAQRPTWRDYVVFMTRRALRTLPLYFVWLTLLLIVFPPKQDAAITALRFLTLTQNLISEMPADYYFVVTWSLSVEEWFYLLFGFALILLARRFSPNKALMICLAVFLVPPLMLRLIYAYRGPLVFFRIDEIAYGVLMAWLYLRSSVLFRHPYLALSAGLAMIAVSLSGVLPLPDRLLVPLSSNVEVIGGALCLPAALVLKGAGWLAPAIRWIAGRSYALYLMHVTFLVDVADGMLFRTGLLPPSVCAVLAVALPFVAAELSYRWLEAPMLRWRPSHRPPALHGLTAAAD